MGREIKFRYSVKRGNGYQFSKIFTMEEIEVGDVLVWYKENFIDLKDVIKDEFTGLRDRNGKEIYEGDIWKRGGFIGAIEFVFSQWIISMLPSSNSYEYPNFYSNAASGEIIGNIRENPELLEGK